MLILGLLILVGAGVVGGVGIFDNRGDGHQLPAGFDAFGRTMHGSTGQLFMWGAVVGAAAMLGLGMLLAGLRADARRRRIARHAPVVVPDGDHEALTGDEPVRAEHVTTTHRTTAHDRENEREREREAAAEDADQTAANLD